MQNIRFIDIPEEYETQIDCINDEIIRNAYSKFEFLYFPIKIFEEEMNCDLGKKYEKETRLTNFLFSFFEKFKFITFQFSYSQRKFSCFHDEKIKIYK